MQSWVCNITRGAWVCNIITRTVSRLGYSLGKFKCQLICFEALASRTAVEFKSVRCGCAAA